MSPEPLGAIMLVVMLGAIFIGFPIAFTLILLAFIFGWVGLGDIAFYIRVHHDLGYTVPFMKGGTDHVAVSGALRVSYRGARFDELERRRVYSAGPPF